jgi:hypothetical protein
LAKVDLVVQGPHWADQDDLGKVLPLIADVRRFVSGEAELGLQIVEPRAGGGQMQVALSLSTETLHGGTFARAVKIETRALRPTPAGADISATFEALNEDANQVFFGLINAGELGRFQGGPST